MACHNCVTHSTTKKNKSKRTRPVLRPDPVNVTIPDLDRSFASLQLRCWDEFRHDAWHFTCCDVDECVAWLDPSAGPLWEGTVLFLRSGCHLSAPQLTDLDCHPLCKTFCLTASMRRHNRNRGAARAHRLCIHQLHSVSCWQLETPGRGGGAGVHFWFLWDPQSLLCPCCGTFYSTTLHSSLLKSKPSIKNTGEVYF